MFSGFFPSLAVFGGFASVSGIGIAASGYSYKDLGLGLQPSGGAYERKLTPQEQIQKESGLTSDLYKNSQCFNKSLKDVNFDITSSANYVIPGTEETGTIYKFPSNSKSCISISWIKWSDEKTEEWIGRWTSVWTVGNNDKEDIFINNLHTENGALYSSGLSYKLEKVGDKWETKERIIIPKTKITSVELKKKLIIKPEDGKLEQGDNYSGFGDPALSSVCSSDKCNSLKKAERDNKRWEFNNDSSSCTEGTPVITVSDWTDYASWRTSNGGLFPYNRLGTYYKNKWQNESSSIKGIPPSNNVKRYSELKGCFWYIEPDVEEAFEDEDSDTTPSYDWDDYEDLDL